MNFIVVILFEKKNKKNIVLIIQFIRIAKIKTFLNYDLEKFRKIKKKNK